MHKGWKHYGHGHYGKHWGRGWEHRWDRGWHGHRGGSAFWFLPGMILLFFLMFGALKFLWPLLLIGLGFLLLKGMMFRRWEWGGGWPDEKAKNDEKRKNDDGRRYIETSDGDRLEII